MTRRIEKKVGLRVVMADDSGLVYSDNWRSGWYYGFQQLGATVETVDISRMRTLGLSGYSGSPFSSRGSNVAAAHAETILKLKPDLVWCYHGRAAGNEDFISRLRRRGVKTAVYLPDEPYETGESVRFSTLFDYVFTMDFCTVEAHSKARGKNSRESVFYLPPCAYEGSFRYSPYPRSGASAFFLGNPTLYPREKYFREVEKCIPGSDIRFWPDRGRPVAKGHPKWIPIDEHPKWYGECKVGLNVHRHPGITMDCYKNRVLHRPPHMKIPQGMVLAKKSPAVSGTGFWNDADLPASHVNPRFFEFAACGTLVVSDDTRCELRRMFPVAPRASDPKHFVELVQYYLDNPNEAELIGRVCSATVFKRHTYKHRAYEVLTRVGLSNYVPEELALSLGALEDFLSPQDFRQLGVKSLSEPTGPSAQWTPPSGSALMRMCGAASQVVSLNAPPKLLPW